MKQTLLCLTLINFYICIVYGKCKYDRKSCIAFDIFGEFFRLGSATNYPCGGDNWIAFKDEKCFKLIKKFATGDEARKICNQEYLQSDSSLPTLASINSAAEQEYLTKFIFDTSGIKISVWIGANRTENVSQFVWDDGSAFDFTNWAEGRPYEEIGMDCVEMQSRYTRKFSDITDSNLHSINGKWKDVACEKANYVLCQKLQIWSLQHLQKTFLDSRKELQDSFKDMTNQLNDTRNQLDNTKKELTTTKNDLTTTINELTNTKNELEVLQKNPSKPNNAYYISLLILFLYSPNWLHLRSTTGSTRTVEPMGISGLDRDNFRVRWTILSCVRRKLCAFWRNAKRRFAQAYRSRF